MNPEELQYTRDHEWISIQGETGTVGITHHAQEQLGDVVFVDLPRPGARFAAGQAFGSVESVKAVSELYCPVSGEVVEVNTALMEHPEAVNSDPYGGGWMIRVRIADPSEAGRLLSASAYGDHVRGER